MIDLSNLIPRWVEAEKQRDKAESNIQKAKAAADSLARGDYRLIAVEVCGADSNRCLWLRGDKLQGLMLAAAEEVTRLNEQVAGIQGKLKQAGLIK